MDDRANISGVGDVVAYTLTIDNNGTLTLSSVTSEISEVKQCYVYVGKNTILNKRQSARRLVGSPIKPCIGHKAMKYIYSHNQDAQLKLMHPCSSTFPGR